MNKVTQFEDPCVWTLNIRGPLTEGVSGSSIVKVRKKQVCGHSNQ